MNLQQTFAKTTAFLLILPMVAVPMVASAQHSSQQKHQQAQKNQWRNIGIGSAALGALGLVTKNNTLMWGGVAGAGYSAWRYEQDRKSQSKADRKRAAFYSRRSYMHNGHRYVRHTTWQKGHKYYTFKRAK